MSKTAATSANAAPKGAATAPLKRYIVRFQDWTAYRLEVMAANEADAVAKAQDMCTGDLWEADIIDGGQEGFEAFPAPARGKGGVT